MAGTYRWQPSFAGGVLGPGLHGRVDLAKYQVGLGLGENIFIHAHGGFSNRAGTKFVAEAKGSEWGQRLIPFERDEFTTYVLALNNQNLRFVQDGKLVRDEDGAIYEITTPYIMQQQDALSYVQSVDVCYLAHRLHPPHKLIHYAADNWEIKPIQIEPDITPDDWLDVDPAAGDAPENLRASTRNQGQGFGIWVPKKKYNYTYVVTAVYAGGESRASNTATVNNFPPGVYGGSTENPFTVRNRLNWTASTGATGYRIYKLIDGRFKQVTEVAASVTQYEDIAANSGNAGVILPAELTVTSRRTGDETYSYVVSPIIEGVEGRPSTVGIVTNAEDLKKEGAWNELTWPGKAQEYNIYREFGGIFGYIGFSDKPEFKDKNIQPDTNRTPREPATVFSAVGDYPSQVTIQQQRLIWGGSDNQPETIWGSVIADYEDYTRAKILKADDRMIVDISGEKLNRVTGLTGLQDLVVLTGSGEYGVGAQDGSLSATQPGQNRYGSSGSSGVRPLTVGESILYVDRSGQLVRDMKYSFESDGYAGNDLSILASHYFSGRKVVDWAYCHSPFGIVWLVMNDGSVLSLTYKREQEVWAWTQHNFGGKVESLCSIHEDGHDALYLSVLRNINGTERRYIERMYDRTIVSDVMETCFLDAAAEYEGPPTTEVDGLSHLDGMTVTAIGDGNVFHDLEVIGGKVELPRPCSKAYVGLPYSSDAETLPLYVELQGIGSSRGLPVKATEAFIQMEKSRGVKLTSSANEQFTSMVQTGGDLARDIPLFTGLWKYDIGPNFDNNGLIRVKQEYPLPMTVLGISPKWVVGRE